MTPVTEKSCSSAHPDAPVMVAEKLIPCLRSRAATLKDGGKAQEKLFAEITEIHDNALATPITTLAGAACVLRHLLDPKIGMDGDRGPNDTKAVRHILAVVEREAAKGGAS